MAKKAENTNGKPTHDEIAQRARQIYERSGRQPGHDMDNWLAAEAQLRAERESGSDTRPVSRSTVTVQA